MIFFVYLRIMNNKDIALEFAKSKGFVSVNFWQKWNGFDVFVANHEDDDILIVGYPFFILVKNDVARENNPSELYDIMGLSEVPTDFAESLE